MSEVKVIEIGESVFAENEAAAASIREQMKKQGTFFVNVMSGPGSGKTTTLSAIINRMKDKYKIGEMDVDIETSIDAQRVADATGVESIQIHNMGLCHIDADMTSRALSEYDTTGLDLLILENIGNLVCPAEFDVGANKNLMLLSVPEGDVLAGEIPGRQLRNAQTFIDMRTEELMLNWKLCMEGKDVVWIDPIR